jgi:hypothetical protein
VAANGASSRTRLAPVTLAIVTATAIALGLRFYQLSRPGFLFGVTEYDDGTDFGSAIRLVTGALPYRDFIIVQPPGITLLMVPAALFTKVAGSSGALAIGRVLTVLASSAGVVLAGLLVRHRGLLAVMISCGLLAVFPDSVLTAKTVLLEPWLVLFCLAGAVAAFDRDRLAGNRRLAVAGLLFGFAGAIKVWAILPVVVLLILAWRRRGRAAGTFGASVVAGFVVPVVPFAALAPVTFYRGVVVAQLLRTDVTRIPLGTRLVEMTGLTHTPGIMAALLGLVCGLLIVVIAGSCALASRLTRRAPAPLEWFALGSLALVAAAFLWPADFYYHYAAFLAPFLALSLALPVARLAAALADRRRPRAASGLRGPAAPAPGNIPAPEKSAQDGAAPAPAGGPAPGGPAPDGSVPAADGSGRASRSRLPRPGPRSVAALPWLVGAVLIAFTALQAASVTSLTAAVPPSEISAARHAIRPGACVLADQVSYAMAADRFVSDVPGCSQMVDGVGTDYALSHGRNGTTGAAQSAAVRAVWQKAFRYAQYVWLTGLAYRRIPWTPGLHAYFRAHFVPVSKGPTLLYARRGRQR